MSKHGWTYKKLGEVAEIVGGSTPKTSNPDFWGGEHYWVTPAELGDFVYINKTERTITDEALAKTNLTLLPVGTVLLSSRAPIGKTAITTVPMYCNQGFKNIICSKVLNNKFVYYYINRIVPKLQSLGRGATFKEISKSIVESTTIPVPGMAEQEAIVAELDEINEAIAEMQLQIADLDTLAQSTFYDMFGDPITNPKGWDIKKLGEVATDKLSYGSGASATSYDGEIRYIRITDIKDNGELNDDVVSPNSIDIKYLLKEGDILFARSGATVGKTYCHSIKNGKCLYAGYLIRMIPNRELVLPVFVFAYTRTNFYRSFVEMSQRAVAQPNINAQQYSNLDIPVPPLTLQQEFAEKVEAIEAAKAELNAQIAEMQTLLASRMDYYFD